MQRVPSKNAKTFIKVTPRKKIKHVQWKERLLRPVGKVL